MIVLLFFLVFVCLVHNLSMNIVLDFSLYLFSNIGHYLFIFLLGILVIFFAWCFDEN